MKNLLYFIFSLFLCLQAEIAFAATQNTYLQISQKPILSSQKQNFMQKKRVITYQINKIKSKFWEIVANIKEIIEGVLVFSILILFISATILGISIPFLFLFQATLSVISWVALAGLLSLGSAYLLFLLHSKYYGGRLGGC